MIKKILNNGLKVIYTKREGNLTSINIGLSAGAIEEQVYGVAHFVEHMLYKGTNKINENQINTALDDIFAFQNAMTNYPYVIYYGTCLSSDFQKALELFLEILTNPCFTQKGLQEEKSIILEELKEWQDDLMQYGEDMLLFNSFHNKRIRERIIGTNQSIKSINIEDLVSFYESYYCPENTVISIATSLSEETSFNLINSYFEKWKNPFNKSLKNINETNKPGVFTDTQKNTQGAKIQLIYSIDKITEIEFKHLLVFNHILGEGPDSILYKAIRTEATLAYDVGSIIKNEEGIKLFKIYLNTSKDKIDKALDILNSILNNFIIDEKQIQKVSKRIKLKRELKLESSIQLVKELTTYELMYNDFEKVYKEVEQLGSINAEDIMKTVKKYLKTPSIQIIK